jgi:hypothetical protein
VVCRSNGARVSPSHRRHLARRSAQPQPGSCGEHFDVARGVEGRRDAVSYSYDGPLDVGPAHMGTTPLPVGP